MVETMAPNRVVDTILGLIPTENEHGPPFIVQSRWPIPVKLWLSHYTRICVMTHKAWTHEARQCMAYCTHLYSEHCNSGLWRLTGFPSSKWIDFLTTDTGFRQDPMYISSSFGQVLNITSPKVLIMTFQGLGTDSNTSTTSWWLNQPIWENMNVKLDHFPKVRGEHKKILETTITT